MKITKDQSRALFKLWKRNNNNLSFLSFRRTVSPLFSDSCIMVPWCGMVIGIETDGHSHS